MSPNLPTTPVVAALDDFAARRDTYVSDLIGLCRVAGISTITPSTEDMRVSAVCVAALADHAGLEHAMVREWPDAHPYVTADWLHSPGAPTLLFYSHHDVQPFGDLARWTTPPTHPEIRDGRLYARGAVDDKGGIVAQLAAIGCWMRTSGGLPCNVRLLVDGEEEIGSPHLRGFLAAHPELAADVVVVLDTPNAGRGAPALTCGLRGHVIVDVDVSCLDEPIHSGRGAGLVPDPIQVLCSLVGRMHDERGVLQVPELTVSSASARQTDASVVFDEPRFRREIGLRKGVELSGDPFVEPLDRLWRHPALTVIALEAPDRDGATNQIVPSARARLAVRTAPETDPIRAGEALVRQLSTSPPFGAIVQASVVRSVPGWSSDSRRHAHRVAAAALEKGYGQPAAMIGAGGSIGFMEPIARRLPDAPCLLMGLEDPECRAHAPNESVDLADWESATRSTIHLIHDLSTHRSA